MQKKTKGIMLETILNPTNLKEGANKSTIEYNLDAFYPSKVY